MKKVFSNRDKMASKAWREIYGIINIKVNKQFLLLLAAFAEITSIR